MTNTYPFSQGTVEGDVLSELTGDQQVAILQNTGVWDDAEKVRKILNNSYEGMTKLQIVVNGETKELHLDNESLRVDSSDWKETKIGGVKVKINPEKDITEYLEGELAGEQLFSQEAAVREGAKLGKRLPFADDNTPEFQAIIKEVGVEEFKKLFPGLRSTDGSVFGNRGGNAYFWSASSDGDNTSIMELGRGGSRALRDWFNRSFGLSVRLVKD